MDQLIQQFMDRYLSREEIAYRLPVSIPIGQFWPVMEEARKKNAISLPLKAQNGLPFWFVINKTIEAQCDAVAAIARRSFVFDELSEKTMEEATIDEAVWSSVIEGAFTSKAEAARIIQQNKSPSNKSEQMVKNNYQALMYVLEHLEDPITAQTLIDIARMVTCGASDETVEGFRTIPVYVTGREGIVFTPPDAAQVPAQVEDLLAFITDSELPPAQGLYCSLLLRLAQKRTVMGIGGRKLFHLFGERGQEPGFCQLTGQSAYSLRETAAVDRLQGREEAVSLLREISVQVHQMLRQIRALMDGTIRQLHHAQELPGFHQLTHPPGRIPPGNDLRAVYITG